MADDNIPVNDAADDSPNPDNVKSETLTPYVPSDAGTYLDSKSALDSQAAQGTEPIDPEMQKVLDTTLGLGEGDSAALQIKTLFQNAEMRVSGTSQVANPDVQRILSATLGLFENVGGQPDFYSVDKKFVGIDGFGLSAKRTEGKLPSDSALGIGFRQIVAGALRGVEDPVRQAAIMRELQVEFSKSLQGNPNGWSVELQMVNGRPSLILERADKEGNPKFSDQYIPNETKTEFGSRFAQRFEFLTSDTFRQAFVKQALVGVLRGMPEAERNEFIAGFNDALTDSKYGPLSFSPTEGIKLITAEGAISAKPKPESGDKITFGSPPNHIEVTIPRNLNDIQAASYKSLIESLPQSGDVEANRAALLAQMPVIQRTLSDLSSQASIKALEKTSADGLPVYSEISGTEQSFVKAAAEINAIIAKSVGENIRLDVNNSGRDFKFNLYENGSKVELPANLTPEQGVRFISIAAEIAKIASGISPKEGLASIGENVAALYQELDDSSRKELLAKINPLVASKFGSTDYLFEPNQQGPGLQLIDWNLITSNEVLGRFGNSLESAQKPAAELSAQEINLELPSLLARSVASDSTASEAAISRLKEIAISNPQLFATTMAQLEATAFDGSFQASRLQEQLKHVITKSPELADKIIPDLVKLSLGSTVEGQRANALLQDIQTNNPDQRRKVLQSLLNLTGDTTYGVQAKQKFTDFMSTADTLARYELLSMISSAVSAPENYNAEGKPLESISHILDLTLTLAAAQESQRRFNDPVNRITQVLAQISDENGRKRFLDALTARALESTEPNLKKAFALQMSTLIGDAQAQALLTDFLKTVSTQPGALEKLGLSMQVDPATGERGVKLPARDGYEYFVSLGRAAGPDLAKVELDLLNGSQEERLDAYRTLVAHLGTGRLKPEELNPIIEKVNAAAGEDASKRLSFSPETNLLSLGDLTLKQFTLTGQDYTLPANLTQSQIELFQATVGNLISGRISQLPTNMSALLKDSSPEAVGAVLRELQNVIDEKLPADKKFTLEPHPLGLLKKGPQDAIQLFTADGRSVAVNGDEAVLSQTATAQILAKVNMLSAAIKNGAPLSTISDLISAIPPADRRMAEVLYSMGNGSGLKEAIGTKYGADSQVAQINSLLDITEGQPLDTQFQTNYDQLIKAIQDRNTELIGQILSSMPPSDRHRASALFEATSDIQATGSETKMLAAIKAATRSDIIAFLKIEAMLKSRDGETNLAGNARVALELIRAGSPDDRLKGLRVMASLLAQMNSKDSERLLADFQTDYGLSFKNELASLNSQQLSSQYKEIFTSLLAGWDKLEAPVIAQLAEKAVMAGDIMVLGSIISGNRERTIEARNLLAQNQSFKRYVEEHFSGSDLTSAKDLLRDGRIALATVLEADYGSSWWKNPENSELTFKNATEQERKDYALGRELVLSGRAPANAQELAAKQFYERLTQVLTSKVDPVQAKVLEEILLQGDKSLFAGVAQQRYQGWLLGIGAGSYKTNDIMSRVENMTEKEWQALKDPVYFKFFTEALRSFTTPEEQARITALVQRKINAPKLGSDAGPPSFSDSQAIMRGINDFMLDYMRAGVTDLKGVAAHFQNMSNQEAALYKLNPQFRLQVDDFVKYKLSGDDVETRAAKLLIDGILSQALSSGKAPVLSDVDKFLVARLTREVPAADDHEKRRILALDQMNQLEALLPKGSELSARMLAVANGGGNEADRVLYDVFKSVMLADGYLPASRREVGNIGDTRLKALIDNGSVSGLLKVQLTGGLTSNYWNTGTMRELARLSPAERATLNLSPELVKVLDNVIAQGEGRPADRARTMVLNGAKFDQVMREFSTLDAEQFAQMKADYQSKYGSDLLPDIISGITKAEKPPGRAGAQYKFSPEKADVLRNIIENNGVSLADRLRLFAIGNGENYREFQDVLSSLDEAGRFALKADYFRRYKSNVEVQVIDKLPDNSALREQFKNYFAVGQGSDNVQLFLNNMAEFSYLSVYDGTTLGRQRSLLIHGEELKDIHAVFMQLPRERQEEIARYYAEATKNNFESAEAKAQFMTDMALLVVTVAATVGVTMASGGMLGPAAVAVLSKLSTAQLMAVSGAAFAAIRPALATSLLDDSVPLTPEFLIKNGLMGALEGALVIPLGGLGGKAAIEVVQSGVTNVAEKATLSEAGKTLAAQALQAEMALKVAQLPAEQAGKLLQFANGDSALLNKLVELGSAGNETLVNTLLTLPQDHVNNLLNAAGQNSLLLEKLAAMPQGEAVKLLQASAGQPDQLMTALSQMNPQELVTAAGNDLTLLAKMVNAKPEMLAAAGNDLTILAKMVAAKPEMLAAAGNDLTVLAKMVAAKPEMLAAAGNDLTILAKMVTAKPEMLSAAGNDLTLLAKMVAANPEMLSAAGNDLTVLAKWWQQTRDARCCWQ
ncbi:MAG: hypothetical protein KIT34_07855 [Cyanobacteria bacterium TGS_CYA1]|nr:hypothetical protein [Cyanobacteria bacterium TGS_CYA1]